MVALLGTRDELLKLVEQSFNVDILVRGSDITVTGDDAVAGQAIRVFDELVKLLDVGQALEAGTVQSTIDMVRGEDHPSPAEILSDEALTHRGRSIRPKTFGQKQYLDAIRANTVTFGIGPAGTGKTYLAMAMAVLALRRKDVSRIILTRPAVEAGERLGFLPGTLFEKIDPYLRPLFDALHDMMDSENLSTLMERGVIEVAPLAYMRGRAQPVETPVLTPDGWRPIGELQPGDLVVGSDGRPTAVLGVFPQGEKDVYRVTAQDGASTLCCGEHLWSVQTRADRRRGRRHRVLETHEMIGKLRAAHARRYELPTVRPVEFPGRDVPLDPYALGLLLGDGCITDQTTPGFTTTDLELAPVGRGAVITANPVSAALRQLGLAGTRSHSKFVPEDYLWNSSVVRHAVLQGLLDSDGGPVSQRGRSCRIQWSSTSARLADDMEFLVRSLGGVAHRRTHHDAHVLDIRLPADVVPFRLQRKREVYERHGGGRPMRFIDSIEPAGRADTVCIQVAAADSLYVTEDFLVTHNTLNDAFIVLDEAQNTSAAQMKMFLTRIGFGSKAVVTGDITQVDLPGESKSGLRVVRDILTDIDGIGFAELTGRDVVRHRIVQEIVAAYERWDDADSPNDEPKRRPPQPQLKHGPQQGRHGGGKRR